MRALKKICTIVYLLSAVVVAGGFACLQFGSEHVRNRIAELLGHPAGRIVLIVCTVVLLLGVLITALLVFAERSPLTSVHPGGNPNIEVRLAALTSVARAAAELGALQPLDVLLAGDKTVDPSDFYDAALQSGSAGGVQYALPYECVPTLMFVNKTLLENEGIPVPENDWTWDDFYTICAQVTRDTDGDGIIDQFGS